MSSLEESKVSGIIKSLAALEDDLDSLNTKLADMKKNLNIKANAEIENLKEKVRQMATKEAETIITQAKEKANTESSKIKQEGEAKLAEIQANIDSNFDDAVNHVVSTVLKA